MTMFRTISKPGKDEYPPYSQIYMDHIRFDGNVLEQLEKNYYKLRDFIYSIPAELLSYRYAIGKWTIKEILVHLIDDERIFAYRALRYGRNDSLPLYSFDPDSYAVNSRANERSLDNIFEEFEAVRKSTVLLFQNLPEEALMRWGKHMDKDGKVVFERTVRSLVYHLLGHELNHIKVIKERYLKIKVGEEVI